MSIHGQRRLLMGIGSLMIPIPRVVAAKGLRKGVSAAHAKANLLSPEESEIHHFIVKSMAVGQEQITAEFVSDKLAKPLESVERAIDKLEGLKTFLYRSDGIRINWAFPLSLENTGHNITVSTGERFFAA